MQEETTTGTPGPAAPQPEPTMAEAVPETIACRTGRPPSRRRR